jgi:ABC-type transport system involved in multi-copper enzyme maturation permease subunit
MMTVLTSVDTISGEVASGTIHTLVSKPIHRREIVIGKWLGYGTMYSFYILLMAGGVVAVVYLLSGYLPDNVTTGLALMLLNSLLLLSVSLLGGTYFSTLANGVLIFGLYSIAFIGSWIEQFGALIRNTAASQIAQNIGIVTSLVLPSEALWRRVAYMLESPIVSAVGFSPFSAASVPSTMMIVYAVIYLAAAFWLAVRQFNRRDL